MTEPLDSPPLSLITRERSSKLELLIHLLTNLTQPLVLCGPDGIGKTTVLKTLQSYKEGVWQYCYIQGHTGLSFEDTLNQIGRKLQIGKETTAAELNRVYNQYQNKNKKIVLLIDDAGSLVPGLITSIMQYAESNPCLRVIFSLTHNDIYVVGRSDQAVDNCHFIELPPLSESQCGEFLKALAVNPKTGLTLSAISDTMIAQIYADSRGIPGKIIAELPTVANEQPSGLLRSIVNLVMVLSLVLLGIQGLRSERFKMDKMFLSLRPLQETETIKLQEHHLPDLSEDKSKVDGEQKPDIALAPANQENDPLTAQTELADTAPTDINPEEMLANRTNDGEDDSIEGRENPPDDSNPNQASDARNATTESATIEPATPTSQPEPAITDVDGDQLTWLTAQPGSDYTLQLMVLNKLQPILQLQQRYQDIASQIKFVKRVKFGKERYIVLYGSFASIDLAKEQIAALPKEFKQAMPRQISAILAELK